MNTQDRLPNANKTPINEKLKSEIHTVLSKVVDHLQWFASNYPELLPNPENAPTHLKPKIARISSRFSDCLKDSTAHNTYSRIRDDNNPLMLLKSKTVKNVIARYSVSNNQVSSIYEELIQGLEGLQELTNNLNPLSQTTPHTN